MNLFGVLGISGSALSAQRQRAEVVASNLANAETTATPGGGPYRRQQVVFGSKSVDGFHGALRSAAARGVEVKRVVADPSDPVTRFDPSHPDADEKGYVSYPAIDPIEEMVDLLSASRAYQLNASAVEATKNMIQSSLTILG